MGRRTFFAANQAVWGAIDRHADFSGCGAVPGLGAPWRSSRAAAPRLPRSTFCADALGAVDLTAVVGGSNRLPNTLAYDPHSVRADVHQRRNNRSNALVTHEWHVR